MTSTNTNQHTYATVQPDGSLSPLSDIDRDFIHDRYDAGNRVRVRLSMPRTTSRPRLYWGVLREVMDHLPGRWTSVDDLHDAVKLELGLVRPVNMLSGGVKYLTAGTGFEKGTVCQYWRIDGTARPISSMSSRSLTRGSARTSSTSAAMLWRAGCCGR